MQGVSQLCVSQRCYSADRPSEEAVHVLDTMCDVSEAPIQRRPDDPGMGILAGGWLRSPQMMKNPKLVCTIGKLHGARWKGI